VLDPHEGFYGCHATNQKSNWKRTSPGPDACEYFPVDIRAVALNENEFPWDVQFQGRGWWKVSLT
jgi:hypothetical protein